MVNPKTAHKNAQKRSENFKLCIHNFFSTGINFAQIWLSMCANGSVRSHLLGSFTVVMIKKYVLRVKITLLIITTCK